MGAALIAGVGIGEYAGLEEASGTTYRVRRRFSPNPEHRERYETPYGSYRGLYGPPESVHNELSGMERRTNETGGV